jgi:hypothetical protein
VPGTAAGRALGAALAALSSGSLPGPLDYTAAIPPTGFAWVRRVPGANLWIYYRFDDAVARAVALSATPPVPLASD